MWSWTQIDTLINGGFNVSACFKLDKIFGTCFCEDQCLFASHIFSRIIENWLDFGCSWWRFILQALSWWSVARKVLKVPWNCQYSLIFRTFSVFRYCACKRLKNVTMRLILLPGSRVKVMECRLKRGLVTIRTSRTACWQLTS